MCETRWVDWHENIIRFKELCEAIYFDLKKLQECSHLDTLLTAFQLTNSISNSVFIIALHVIEKFSSTTLPLSIALQKVNVNLSYCYERVTDICQIFKEIRDNADEELKWIFSYSEVSMFEGIMYLKLYIVKRRVIIFQAILRNNIIKNPYFYLFWTILFVN